MYLNLEQLALLSNEVGENSTLLVCCGSFTPSARDAFDSLAIKKIPKAVFKRCERGHDDCSLRVENLPKTPPKPGQVELFSEQERGVD